MRICMIAPCIHGPQYGGVQRSGASAWHGITASDRFREPALLGYGEACHDQGQSGAGPCHRSKLAAVLGAVRLRRRWDGILVWHLGMLKLAPFLRRAGTPLFLYLHGVECWHELDPASKKLAGSVDCFFTNSDFTWSRFIQHNAYLVRARHQTVALGLDSSPPFTRLPDRRPIALMVGRMDRGEAYKGHAAMIQAWPRVLRNLPDAELWIVGDGDLRPELEELARDTEAAAHTRFFGAVSDERKNDFLMMSRCLALPSRGEGFGLVYLEAMRHGRPCLVSTADAGREVVNPPEAGLAADPGDPEALVAAVCRLLTEGEEWDRWSANARLRYQRQYTEEAFQNRLIQALAAEVSR